MRFIFTKPIHYTGFSLLLATLLSFSFLSCNDEAIIPEERLVIEAYIDDGGFPYVILTSSMSPSTQPESINEHVIRWGKVTITDGIDTIVMTGNVNGKVFPPFIYDTFYLRGERNKTYTIEAEYKGMRAKATTNILPKPDIVRYNVSPVNESDSLRAVSVEFVPDSASIANGGCFVAFVKDDPDNRYFNPCFLGTFRTSKGTDKIEIPIFKPKMMTSDIKKYSPNFKVGDVIEIMVAHVEENVYDYWEQYQNQIGMGHSSFFSSGISPVGNVVGGLGCFTGRGADSVLIEIK